MKSVRISIHKNRFLPPLTQGKKRFYLLVPLNINRVFLVGACMEQRTVGGEFGCRIRDLGTRGVLNTPSDKSANKKHTLSKNEIRQDFYT